MVFLMVPYGTYGNSSFLKKENAFKNIQKHVRNKWVPRQFKFQLSSLFVPEPGLGLSIAYMSLGEIHLCKI